MKSTNPQFAAVATRILSFTIAGILLSYAVTVQAAPLDLIPGQRDIASFSIYVQYDATTDMFTASGTAMTFDVPAPLTPIDSGTFDLSAVIDDTGTASAGTLTIGGTIAALGFNSGTLLTANLDPTEIGFLDAPGGEVFEFLFDVTGGQAASLFGTRVGVILNAQNSGFNGTFAANFSNNSENPIGFADTFAQGAATPEPSSAVLALGGLVLVCLRRRSPRRKTVSR